MQDIINLSHTNLAIQCNDAAPLTLMMKQHYLSWCHPIWLFHESQLMNTNTPDWSFTGFRYHQGNNDGIHFTVGPQYGPLPGTTMLALISINSQSSFLLACVHYWIDYPHPIFLLAGFYRRLFQSVCFSAPTIFTTQDILSQIILISHWLMNVLYQ